MSALNDANTRQTPEITDLAAALTEPKVFRVSSSCDLRTLFMKLRSLILTLTFLVPSAASAAPITVGVWSPAPPADADLNPYWDGLSFDCPTCGVGYLLYGEYPGLEYLNNGAGGFTAFAFEEPILDWTLEYSITAWTHGVLGQRADGAFTYNSGTGRISNSIDNPGQYALFRHVTPEWTEYYLAIEDILLDETVNDRDYNDYVVSFTVPTQTVPEPSTLLLLALPVFGLVGRSVRGRRRTEARG
jgi:PEP-CTERM motif